jgi:uncharacterized protein (DUF433 family)
VAFTRITADPGVLGGQPCIRGTRIPVAAVVAKVAEGMSVAEIIATYPDLIPDDVTQALLYAAEAVRDRCRAERTSAGEGGGRTLEVPDTPRLAHYIGNGLSYGGAATLSGTSRLEFFDWGIRMEAGPLASRLGARYELSYGELLEARAVGRMVRQGVRFRAACLRRPVIFLTVDGREILNRLEQHHVPVNHKRISLLSPGG